MMLPFEITKNGISSVLGYTSIGCWLCAQVPQVLENVRLQSCEGLALPFLMTWLGGDVTNLIGCLLTDQLPFQTYLASYFCCVDILLTSQFIYYRRLTRSSKPSRRLTATPNMSASFQTTSTHLSPHLRTRSTTHIPPLRISSHVSSASYLPPSTASTAKPRGHRQSTSSQTTDTLAALQSAAMDVVLAAEKVQERSRSRRRATSRVRNAYASSSRRPVGSRTESGSAEDGGGSGDMMESFYSEASAGSSVASPGQRRGGLRKGKSREVSSSEQSPVLTTSDFRDSRGRPLRRMLETVDSDVGEGESTLTVRYLGDVGIEGLPNGNGNGHFGDTEGTGLEERFIRRKSKSRSRSIARQASGRAAGVLFMGVFALFGVGRMGSGFGLSGLSRRGEVGRRGGLGMEIMGGTVLLYPGEEVGITTIVEVGVEEEEDPHWPEIPTAQRIIGRTSAWACTTLYLTSRLPQIWKNFERKSVEGLSIMLFVFAFFGNLTYVVSILLNPSGSADPSEAAHYLLESLPYLLGSGGTLLFDLTIMLQAIIYRLSSSPHDIEVGSSTRKSSRRRTRDLLPHSEEEQPLIRERSRSVHRSVSTDSAVLAALRADGKRRSLSRQPSRVGRTKGVRSGEEGLGLVRGQSVGMVRAKEGWETSPVRVKGDTDRWAVGK